MCCPEIKECDDGIRRTPVPVTKALMGHTRFPGNPTWHFLCVLMLLLGSCSQQGNGRLRQRVSWVEGARDGDTLGNARVDVEERRFVADGGRGVGQRALARHAARSRPW